MASVPQEVEALLQNRSATDPSLIYFLMENSPSNPLCNRLVIGPGRAIRYEWPISPAEHRELVDYLGPEYEKGPTLKSTYVESPQELCRKCGTPSTFSDSVRIALADGIHSPEFMIMGIRNDVPGKGEEHRTSCKMCGEMYDGTNNWPMAMGWGDLNSELCGSGSG